MRTKIKVSIEKAHRIVSLYPIQLQALQYFFALQEAVHMAIAKLEWHSATRHKDRCNILAK